MQNEFDQFKAKSKQDFEAMQDQLNSQHKREMEALKDKYEKMISELKLNANSDKEFMQNELKKKIKELEK